MSLVEWYVVMRRQGWDTLSLTQQTPILPYPVVIQASDDPNQPSGWLPLFDTYEAAVKWADGDPIRVVRPLEERP